MQLETILKYWTIYSTFLWITKSCFKCVKYNKQQLQMQLID